MMAKPVSKNFPDDLSFAKENMIVAPSSEKNKDYILDTLRELLPKSDTPFSLLEISSGPGQHVAHFAPHFPHITWQPSDIEDQFLRSIVAHTENAGVSNIKPPLYIDISKPTNTEDNGNIPDQSMDFVLNMNMIHIAPWECSLALFSTASRVLKPSGLFFMYGPFKIDGVLAPESNVKFDQCLRNSDPRWGVRDTADLKKLAEENGLKFEKMIDHAAANNKFLTFRKV